MELTQEQIDIINTDLKKGQVLKISAFAGAAKTSTLKEYAAARPDKTFLYIAYNKNVADEASETFTSNVTCKTSHALAFPEFGKKYLHKLGPVKNFFLYKYPEFRNFNKTNVNYLIDSVTRFLYSPDEEISEKHVWVRPELKEKIKISKSQAVRLCDKIWNEMQDVSSEIPMPHDGYLKLYQFSNPQLNYDYILLDEAQDTNPVVASIFERQKTARILVGDPHQSIYQWRLAANSMDFPSDFVRYLTTSFRFGPNIANYANVLLGMMKGERQKIKGFQKKDLIIQHNDVELNEKYTIISRTNGSLFNFAYNLANQNVKIHFLGGSKGFNVILNSLWDIYYLKYNERGKIKDSYIQSFNNYYEFKEAVNDVYSQDAELQSRAAIIDSYELDFPKVVDKIKEKITKQERSAQVILTTVHKSKGLQWDVVFLVNDFRLPSLQNLSLETCSEPEINLLYVAITRAKKILILPDRIQELFSALLDKNKN